MVEIKLPENRFTQSDLIWPSVVEFLDQDSLTNLSQCNSFFLKLGEKKLYQNIHILSEPPLRTDQWFIDTNKTYVFGYRSMLKSDNQNDMFLYDKLERLLESGKTDKIQNLYIGESPFHDYDSGVEILDKVMNQIFEHSKIKDIDIKDEQLFDRFYSRILSVSSHLEYLRIKSLEDSSFIGSCCKSLQIDSSGGNLSDLSSLPEKIECLILPDYDSLDIISIFQRHNIQFKNLKSFKFNHLHIGASNQLNITSLLSVIPLGKLTEVEIGFCCEVDDCLCGESFFADLGPLLLGLSSLSLIEKSIETSTHHSSKEKWDIDVNHFIMELPYFGANLKKLSIMHNIPPNGQVADSVDGNYFRRRRMYEQMLPHLINLETLIAPTFIQSLSCFEVLSCDFLWNGCKCPYCQKILGILDKYIHNHIFFNDWFSDFKDISPTNLVGYGSDSLSNRLLNKKFEPLKTFHDAPLEVFWNFHGYDKIGHYHGYECYFDESAFKHLAACFQHFTDTYMEYIVHFLPSLKTCCLSGVYYYIEDHAFHSVYDHAG